MGLVPPLRGVGVMEVVVVEFWVVQVSIVVVPVVVAWTAKVILDIEVIVLIAKTKRVIMVVILLRFLVLGRKSLLKTSPLDGGGHLVRIGLFFWIVDSNVIVSEFIGIVAIIVSVIPEVFVLEHRHTMDA